MLAFFLLKPLFGLLLSLLKGFRITRRIICRFELLNFIRFSDPGIFHCSALGLYLSRSKMTGIITSLSLVVYLPNVVSRLETHFDFKLNCLLNHLFLGIYFSNPLLYLSIYQGFKIFLEEFNEIGLFWSPINIKL